MSSATTIPEALFATAERGAGGYVFHLDGRIVRLSSAELAERAQCGAQRLFALGVEPGDAVGLLGPNRPEWVVWAFATWLAGAALVPIQIPLRVRDPTTFAARLRALVAAGGCRRVIADPAFVDMLPAGLSVAWGGDGAAASPGGLAPPDPDAAAVIQFTSGSTAAPKGALLTHAAMMAQMDILRAVHTDAEGAPREILSWAPYFHDLGLVANLILPAVWGNLSHQLPTDLFARDPAEWLRLVERTRCTMTVGPSSAFGSAIKAAQRRGEAPDLSSLDVAFFAAEGVDPSVAARLAEADFRLRSEALGSTYGLAETVLAAAYSETGSGLRFDRIVAEALASDGIAVSAGEDRARAIASTGPPKMELRIVGPEGQELPERRVGEIMIRGASMMTCYVGAVAPDPFLDGWLRTGDLGYLAGGELYVTGRSKDMVIVMGQNYYPEDFEWAAGRVDGVRPGRCVAFNPPGTEGVVLLVEPVDGGGTDVLRRRVRQGVANAVGIAPTEVVIVPRGTVEKTTSGKLRRAAMRDAYAGGALTATVP